MNGQQTNEKLVAQAAQFTPLSDYRAQLGESPVWSPDHNAIWWVDIDGRKLLCTSLDGSTKQWETPEIPGFVECLSGVIYVGMQTGIFKFLEDTSLFVRIASLHLENQRFNDACLGADGCIWAGTMDLSNAKDNGVLFAFNPRKRTLNPMLHGFQTLNGLAWDDNSKRLYVSDSHPNSQTVWTYKQSANGKLSQQRTFTKLSSM